MQRMLDQPELPESLQSGRIVVSTLGKRKLRGVTYPAVYHHYLALTVGENSVYNVDMPGNAVRFDDAGAGMTIKKGAVVNLTSKQASGSVVAFSNNNTYLNAEPGAIFMSLGQVVSL